MTCEIRICLQFLKINTQRPNYRHIHFFLELYSNKIVNLLSEKLFLFVLWGR